MPSIPSYFHLGEKTAFLPIKWAVLAFFSIALLVVKFGFHEMWKDEWQAWLMARDMGWGELTASLFYEGHPALWYYYLKIWTSISSVSGLAEHHSLQLAHWMTITAAMAVFVFKVRLAIAWKIAILSGYFFFFEYGVVNRGYALVMLLAMLNASWMLNADRQAWKLAIGLLLLCQTEVFGVLMAGALFFYLLLDNDFLKKPQAVLLRPTILKVGVGLLLGVGLFILTVYPRGEKEALSQAYTSAPFSASNMGEAFQGGLANTYLIGAIPDTNVFGVSGFGIVLSCAVLVALIFFFWPNKKVLFTWLAFTAVFFLFCAGIYPGGVRQWGNAFVFFIVCLQLWSNEQPRLHISHFGILAAILVTQIYYSGLAVYKEIKFPFSHAKEAAQYVKQHVPENVPIVAINKFAAAPVIGYAGRSFYELPDGVPFTYFKWLEKIYLPSEPELKLFAKFKNVGGIVIISDKPLPTDRYPNVRPWQSFVGYNLKNENYHLYALER